MDNRNLWPDYAKGIGIVFVVYGHVARGVFNSKQFSMDNSWFKVFDSIIYSFHMPLFFFLSGLFFYSSLKAYGVFGLILKKTDSIAYPYIVWSLLQGGVELMLSKYTNGHVSLSEVLQFPWHPRAQFWFLYALFFVFFVSSILYGVLKRSHFIAIAILFSFFYIIKSHASYSIVDGYVFSYGVFFALGVLFNDYSQWFENRSGVLSIVLGIVFIISQFVFHFTLGFDYTTGLIPGLALSVISILFIVVFSMFICNFKIYWLCFVGYSSMSIYLMHIIAGSGVRIVLVRFFDVHNVAFHLFFGTVFAVLAPLALSFFIKLFRLNFLLVPPQAISVYRFATKGRGRL